MVVSITRAKEDNHLQLTENFTLSLQVRNQPKLVGLQMQHWQET